MKVNDIYQDTGRRELIRVLDVFPNKIVARFVPYLGEAEDKVLYYKDLNEFELVMDKTHVDVRVFE